MKVLKRLRRMPRASLAVSVLAVSVLVTSRASAQQDLVKLLAEELDYSFEKLVTPDKHKPYFLAFTITDTRTMRLSATLGSLQREDDYRRRVLDVWGNNNSAYATRYWKNDVEGAEALLLASRPDALVAFPMQYAPHLSGPEWERLSALYPDDIEFLTELAAYQQLTAVPMATTLGLTRRAATFSVDRSVTVHSPVHLDLAIFVRP